MLIFFITLLFLLAAGFAGARLLRDVGRELTGLEGEDEPKESAPRRDGK